MCANIIKTIFLPGNIGFTFVLIPMIYGRCRHSRLSDYFASKTARKTEPCLRFLDNQTRHSTQKRTGKKGRKTDTKKLF